MERDWEKLQFMELLCQGAGLTELLNRGEALLGTPLRYTDGMFYPLAHSKGYPADDRMDVSAIRFREAELHKQFVDDLDRCIMADDPFILEAEGMPRRRMYLRIVYGDKVTGFFVIPEVDRPLEGLSLPTLRLLQEVFSLVGRVFQVSMVEGSPERSLLRLLSGTASTQAHLDNCSSLMQMDSAKSYRLLLSNENPKDSAGLRLKLKEVFSCQWITIYQQRLVLLLHGGSAQPSPEQQATLLALGQEAGCRFCLGEEYGALLNTRIWYRRLEKALARPAKAQGLVSYDDCKQFVLFREAAEKGIQLLDYCCEGVREMHKSDRDQGTAYLPLLRAYRDTNKSMAQAAQLLYIHKNTMIYRIERLEKLFKLELSDPAVWLKVCNSLSIIEFLSPEPPAQ